MQINKWVLTLLIVIIVIVLIGVAYDQGLFDNLNGSTMGMLLAGIAAPYMALKRWISGDSFRQRFKEKYNRMEQEEKVHRQEYDQMIAVKEKRITELDKEIQLLDAKLELLELKKKKVEQTVNSMSVEETRKKAQELFGD